MKYKIIVNEKVKFDHEVILEVNDTLNIDSILDKAQNNSSFSDVLDTLREQGCEIIVAIEDECGDNDEIVIDDMEEIK